MLWTMITPVRDRPQAGSGVLVVRASRPIAMVLPVRDESSTHVGHTGDARAHLDLLVACSRPAPINALTARRLARGHPAREHNDRRPQSCPARTIVTPAKTPKRVRSSRARNWEARRHTTHAGHDAWRAVRAVCPTFRREPRPTRRARPVRPALGCRVDRGDRPMSPARNFRAGATARNGGPRPSRSPGPGRT